MALVAVELVAMLPFVDVAKPKSLAVLVIPNPIVRVDYAIKEGSARSDVDIIASNDV